MAMGGQRRVLRHDSLSPDVLVVKQALLARAEAVEVKSSHLRSAGLGDHAKVLMEISAEFRALAEELHYW